MSSRSATAELLRPSVPTLGWLVAALWASLALAQRAQWGAYVSGKSIDRTLLVWIVCTGAAALASLRWRRAVLSLCLAGSCVGFIVGALYWGDWRADARFFGSCQETSWSVEVLADENSSPFGASSPCRVEGGHLDGGLVTVQWPKDTPVPELGRRVEFVANTRALLADDRGVRGARAGNVGTLRVRAVRASSWARSLRGLIGRLRVWAVRRVATVGGEGGALLAGVVVGDRRRLSGTQADDDFRTTGLTHLVAVSGSHLVVVAAVVGAIGLSLGAGRIARSVLVAAVVGGYVVFSGVQPSAVRAWVMAVGAALAWLSGRRADSGSTLAVAAAGLLATAPTSAFDLGFQLSVAAVAGLVLFARLAEAWLTAAIGDRARWVASPVALTLTATAATAPITVSTFGMFSIVSPAANVAAGPLVSASLVCGLLGLATSAVWPWAGHALLEVAAVPALLAVRCAHWLAGWPYAAVPVSVDALPAAAVCAGAAALIWAAWPVPTRPRALGVVGTLCAGLVILAVGPPVAPGSTIEVLDVGQGDAILVRDGARAVLVDAGPSVSQMRAALGRAGVRKLDALVITHLHADHYGGLEALDGVVRVRTILVPTGALGSESPALTDARSLVGSDSVREVAAGTTIDVGRMKLEVLWPRSPVDDAATNEASVVIKATEGRFVGVLTGDAEDVVLQSLVGVSLGDVDVFKVGHHGSAGAVSEEQLATMRPEYSLISVGAGNRFGHPTASTLEVVARSGSRVLRTDLLGDIEVRVSPDGAYRVVVQRGGMRESHVGTGPRWGTRGLHTVVCATLDPTRTHVRFPTVPLDPETHGQATLGVQTRLSHLRRARPPPRATTRQTQAGCRTACRPGVQLADV